MWFIILSKWPVVESNDACTLKESWLPTGNDLRTAPTYEKGIVLEVAIDVKDGFFNPLFVKGTQGSAQSPVARITVEFETRCSDESCVFYFVEVSSVRLQKKTIFWQILEEDLCLRFKWLL